MSALKRELGLFETTLMGVGIILGAGIYVLIGAAAGIAGNSVWMSFTIASIVAIFTGLSYAEFSSRFSDDSGEYDYVKRTVSEKWGFIVGWMMVFTLLISAAAVALGFAGYFARLFASLNFGIVAIAVATIILFSFISYWGIKQAAWLNILFTFLETFGLLFIIYIGLGKIGSVNYMSMPNGFEGVISAAALVFFAFIGFETIVKLAEETRNPKKTVPRAILLSILISTVIYILVAISAVSILSWDKLAVSTAPLADVAAVALGAYAFLALSIIALFSTGNTILIILIGASRQIYGISKNYKKLNKLSKVSTRRKTPHIAVIFTAVVAICFSLIGNIGTVAEITNFAVFATFILINGALIFMRLKERKPYTKGFRVPLSIRKIPVPAVLGLVSSLFLLLQLPMFVILSGLGLLASGAVVHKIVS
ncbi:amino acid permease [Candidatus Woesearchaeota archaeon]|jgi:basic amino acid/polyamine antiporter, APA family|nr:amino acid permease [Candidatus Woesearchaeota archaeon]